MVSCSTSIHPAIQEDLEHPEDGKLCLGPDQAHVYSQDSGLGQIESFYDQQAWNLQNDEHWLRLVEPSILTFLLVQSIINLEYLQWQEIPGVTLVTHQCFSDITLGRRIGFYELKGDIGRGNFSSVRLAKHSITDGNNILKQCLTFYMRSCRASCNQAH